MLNLIPFPNHTSYKYYGGKGIRFNIDSYEDFSRVLGDRPTLNHSLDRINNQGHYEIGNIKWSSKSEQNLNTNIQNTNTTNIKKISLRKAWGYHKDRYIVRLPLTCKVIYSGSDLEIAKQKLKEHHAYS